MIYNFNTNAVASINVPSSTVSFAKYMYSCISKNISPEKVGKKKDIGQRQSLNGQMAQKMTQCIEPSFEPLMFKLTKQNEPLL